MEQPINIAICDDNREFAEKVKEQVINVTTKQKQDFYLYEFNDGNELINHCTENDIDIVLLDIDLPSSDGFAIINTLYELSDKVQVIFVTSHIELAYQAYDYRPYSFVSKSDLSRLDGILTEFFEKRALAQKTVIKLFLDKEITIDVNNVMYLNNHRNYTIANCFDGTTFSFRATIKETYNILKDDFFILIKHGYIVNCRFIEKFTSQYIILKNNQKLSVTRDKDVLKKARDEYGRYIRRSLI